MASKKRVVGLRRVPRRTEKSVREFLYQYIGCNMEASENKETLIEEVSRKVRSMLVVEISVDKRFFRYEEK